MMLERHIFQKMKDAPGHQGVVALIGPRQVGKTTLALEIGNEYGVLYLDLEDSHDPHRLTNPVLFLEKFEDRLVILDEIHRMPDIFETLRPTLPSPIEGGGNLLTGVLKTAG